MNGVVPPHVPLVVARVWPWVGVPMIAGSVWMTGVAPAIAAVCAAVAFVEPAVLLAATTTRIVFATSAVAGVSIAAALSWPLSSASAASRSGQDAALLHCGYSERKC